MLRFKTVNEKDVVTSTSTRKDDNKIDYTPLKTELYTFSVHEDPSFCESKIHKKKNM